MRISLVVAASTNNVIGRDGALPWHISEDLKHFKAITLGHPIIMGRRTFESIGRALPERLNIVVTRNPEFVAADCTVVDSPAAALHAAETMQQGADEVMIIGGSEIYRLFLPMAERIYLTRVAIDVEGDATFPELDIANWRIVEEQRFAADDSRELAFSFQTLERIVP
ncbi:MAG: dihydrofolate reductase [Pseudomonadota bacterium]